MTAGPVLFLIRQLSKLTPAALNRTVAIAEIDGPERALQLIDAIALPRYHLLHAVRADFLRRLGHTADAAAAYQLAQEYCENAKEREFLKRQCQSLTKH